MDTVGIDFEFFNSNEKNMTVVAASLATETHLLKFNLLDKDELYNFKSYMEKEVKNIILLPYAAGAETRALLSLGIDPLQFKWIDLYVEFIMLCNSNNAYKHGDYISDSGDIRFSTPADPTLSDEEKETDTAEHTETPKNLINAAFKMLGVRLDGKHKDEMRNLILSKDLVKIQAHMDEVLEYCASDTKYLRALHIAICQAYEREGLSDFTDDQLARGRYSVCTGMCEHQGIPINMELLNTIIEKTPEILNVHKEDVNRYFKFFIPDYQRPPIKRKNGSVFHYKMTPAHKDMNAYQQYVESLKIPDFPKTATGKYKSDKDTLQEWGNKHRYTQGLDYLLRYNITESSLKWFNKDNKNGFFDRVGSDACVRPYFGPFGTQTGRNAAKAKTFPLAMSSWLRCIIHAGFGFSILTSDFSQQEVYVAAILSGDKNLLEAYNSGDVYLAFAKQAGLVPQTATKSSHKLERSLCKSTVLGLQFGMGFSKLKVKLCLDSGASPSDFDEQTKGLPDVEYMNPITGSISYVSAAQHAFNQYWTAKTSELINAHKNTFATYWQWVYEVSRSYKQGNPLVTNDGWVLWCDNPVMTSVRNFLVQANAASITRLAVVRAWEQGLKVMCSLHDALYIISDNPTRDQSTLENIMVKATAKILKQSLKDCTMRVDSKVISHDQVWAEEKGEKDMEKLHTYLGLEQQTIIEDGKKKFVYNYGSQ